MIRNKYMSNVEEWSEELWFPRILSEEWEFHIDCRCQFWEMLGLLPPCSVIAVGIYSRATRYQTNIILDIWQTLLFNLQNYSAKEIFTLSFFTYEKCNGNPLSGPTQNLHPSRNGFMPHSIYWCFLKRCHFPTWPTSFTTIEWTQR